MKTNIIYNDDCNKILSSFPNESIDMIITDIPYGIEYKSNRQGIDRKSSIKNRSDEYVRESYFTQIENDDHVPIQWLQDAYRILKNNSAIYIFIHWKTWSKLEKAISKTDFQIKNHIVLYKSNHGMGDLKGSFAPKHELLLFATKGRHLLNFPEKRLSDVWEVPVKFSGSRRKHPNEKPESWHNTPIVCSSKKDDIIVDPFCGSGSALIEALKLGRNIVGIEIDHQYYETANQRLQNYLQKKETQLL